MSRDGTSTIESSQVENQPVILETTPTVRPTLIRLGMVGLATTIIIGIIFANPTLLGSVEATNVVLLIVQLLAFIFVVRLVLRILILRRTKYSIKSDSVSREYRVLMRTVEREVPLDRVRSHEFTQSMTESLLGHGTIVLNRGLGTLKLENIPNPDHAYQQICDQVDEK